MRPSARKPRIAIVSPWPPQGSGIADYAVSLARALQQHYDIDAYHDPAIRPDLESLDGVTPIPAPLLPRLQGLRAYRAIIYQMGNSCYHEFLYPLMMANAGIVTLHDFRLTAFHHDYQRRPEIGPGHLAREILHDLPEHAAQIVADLPEMAAERGGIPVALASRGIDLNRRVFERSRSVIVHSRWGVDRVWSLLPEHAESVHRVPFGITPREVISPGRRAEIRDRLGLPREALVFASLGILGWGKMNEEAIEAFAEIARDRPDAIFVHAGRDLDDGRPARKAESMGIADRVRFLGRRPAEDFEDLATVADIGVNLRRSPTNGETSASLFDFLGRGVPTIVTDVDAFADDPDDAIVRVDWQAEGMAGLVRAMRSLAFDAELRDRVGKRAREHVSGDHLWSEVASRYRDVIEQTAESRRRPAV